jgi:hypothetical protein
VEPWEEDWEGLEEEHAARKIEMIRTNPMGCLSDFIG